MAFGSKNSTPSFVLTLPMVISLNEQDLLYKEFKKCGIIYNQLVCITTKMWHQLRKTRKYRELMADIAKAAPDSDEQNTKKKLSERMARLRSGDIVQRDLYSAFLLEHIDTESLQYNMKTLNSAFPAFLGMHENTKQRLQAVGSSLPASIGF